MARSYAFSNRGRWTWRATWLTFSVPPVRCCGSSLVALALNRGDVWHRRVRTRGGEWKRWCDVFSFPTTKYTRAARLCCVQNGFWLLHLSVVQQQRIRSASSLGQSYKGLCSSFTLLSSLSSSLSIFSFLFSFPSLLSFSLLCAPTAECLLGKAPRGWFLGTLFLEKSSLSFSFSFFLLFPFLFLFFLFLFFQVSSPPDESMCLHQHLLRTGGIGWHRRLRSWWRTLSILWRAPPMSPY